MWKNDNNPKLNRHNCGKWLFLDGAIIMSALSRIVKIRPNYIAFSNKGRKSSQPYLHVKENIVPG